MNRDTVPRPPSKASRASFEAVFRCAPDAFFIHDVTGRLIDANDRAGASLGYSRARLLEMSVFDIERENHLQGLRERWAAMPVGTSARTRGVHRRADGTEFEVDARRAAFEQDGRKLILATIRPIDDDASAIVDSDAARDQELSVLNRLLEQSIDAVAITDHKGRYLQQNPAHRALLGYADHDLVDRTPAIHLGPATFHEVATVLGATGQYLGEHIAHTKSGDAIRIELTAFAVAGRDGEPPLYVGIKRNIDAAKRMRRERADRERTELEATLRHAQKMELIGQLAAGVAHDFNNLLTPILGFAEIEMLARRPDDPTSESCRQILGAAERGKDLTRQLLAFGRHQDLDMRVLDLCEQVDQSAQILRRLLPASIEIEFRLADDVRPVRADPTQIQQILMNLATNASDAMVHGGRMRIEVRNIEVEKDTALSHTLGRPGPFVHLSFADEGCGMDAASLDRVFEPFYTGKAPGKGSGLGLSIVHGIVGQHDGFIQARSQVGRGTTFDIYLPPTELDDSAETEPRAAVPKGGAGETVLVVEDEPQVQTLVSRVLQSQGYEVLLANCGEHAVRIEAEHAGSIALLLTDIVMPGMSGTELSRILVGRRPDLRVLFMSGYARDGLAADDRLDIELSMLEKPFSASALSQRVRDVLRG